MAKATTTKPKQDKLPGTTGPISEIEQHGVKYKEAQTERLAWLATEKEEKDEILALMKKYKKREYHSSTLDITISVEKESVHVKVKDPGEEAA